MHSTFRPLAKPRGTVWFTTQQLGRHKLSPVVSKLCKEAGIVGYRTNHSLRASAVTKMYDNEVDEQLICEVTGHRSNAVRGYKRTSDKLKRKVNCVVHVCRVCRRAIWRRPDKLRHQLHRPSQ